MSNELATILANNPNLVQTGLDEDTLAVSGGSFGKRISIKGSVFRKYSSGKEIGAIEDRHMNVIIVKMAHKASRTYYKDGYKEGAKVSPLCWSSNGEVPDAEVKTPQGNSCITCPFSVKGSGDNGVGTKCRLSWRTAVVLPNDPAGDVMQLVLPATSVFGKEDNGRWPFRAYIQHLASHNVSAGRVITKMQFDTKSSTPKVLFSPVGAVPPEDVEIIARQARSPEAEAAIKLTVFKVDSANTEADSTDAGNEDAVVEVAEEEASPPPKKRGSTAAVGEDGTVDVASVVSKWSKKS